MEQVCVVSSSGVANLVNSNGMRSDYLDYSSYTRTEREGDIKTFANVCLFGNSKNNCELLGAIQHRTVKQAQFRRVEISEIRIHCNY